MTFHENRTRMTFHENRTGMTGALHEDQCTFLITSRSVILTMRNVADKSYRENQDTHFILCLLDRTSS